MVKATTHIPDPAMARLRASVLVDPRTGCHLCTYSPGNHGYPSISWREDGTRFYVLAHRAAWIHERGPIPDGMTVDHMCKERRCVRVDHLRLLSNFENARRNNGRDWPIGECRNGHPDSNLGPVNNGTGCLACLRERRERAEAKRRAARSVTP